MIKRKFYTSKAISYLLCICMVLGLLISFPSSSLALDIQSVSSSMILSDISGHWAETHISSWYESGLISGFPDETFKPNNAITRAEFMVLVNRAYGLSEKASINFSDTSDGDWFQDDVAIAVKAGYLVGYGDGTVRPLNNISRQEAAAIIYRLLKLQEHRSNILIEKYLDYGNISPWSREAVNAIVAEGYMVGNTDGTFGPVNKITRAETIVTLSRATGEIYKKAGIYSEIKTITGNATINTQGITLENVVIEGNLYLTPGIGKGEVLLRNVKVKGVVFVDGGGEDLVVFEDCEIENIVGSITPVILTSSGPLPPSGGSWPGGSGGIVLPITKYSLILIGDNISSSPLSGAIAENTTVTVTLAPLEGKDVNIFTVNGLDRKSQLVNNKYTFTINENTTIQVDYIDSNLPDKSVYDILFDPTGIVTGIPKEVEFTLKATEVKSEGYEKVRINVEVIQKPADSLVSLIGNYGAGPVNVIEVGYWGPESGHPLSKDYNLSYPLTATFSKAGQYTIKIELMDLNKDADILNKTVDITVLDYTLDSYFTFDDTTGTITDYHTKGVLGNLTEILDVAIPATINEIPVSIIGNDAFKSKNLTSVIIPDSVIILGETSFSDNELISAAIGDSVTTIGKSAFEYNRLLNVTIGSSVNIIDDYAFYRGGYETLSNIIIPDSVETIGKYAFYMNGLTNISIGNNVKTIGESALYGNRLTSIDLPVRLLSIGPRALMDNNLNTITIGSNVSIGDTLLRLHSSGGVGGNLFRDAYEAAGKTGGIYTGTQSGAWTKLVVKSPPVLVADTSENYAGQNLMITIPKGWSDWANGITEISVAGEIISHMPDNLQYYINPGDDAVDGLIQLYGSKINALQTPGSKDIRVKSTGYSDAVVTQDITATYFDYAIFTTQPVGPIENSGLLSTQPIVTLYDKYDNQCTYGPSSTREITLSAKTGSSWALGGTVTVKAINGVVVFSDLTATNPSGLSITDAKLMYEVIGTPNDYFYSENFTIPGATGLIAPTLIADATNYYAGNTIDIIFSSGEWSDWLSAISAVKVDENSLNYPEQYNIGNEKITLITDEIIAMQRPGTYNITIEASGYNISAVNQQITAGQIANAKFTAQPKGPSISGGLLQQQPIVTLYDKYDNPCTDGPDSSRSVNLTRAVNDSWTLSGTTSKMAINGVATFTDLTSTNPSGSQINDAKLSFTYAGPPYFIVDSEQFTIPGLGNQSAPSLTADTTDNYAGNTIEITFVDDPDWRVAVDRIILVKDGSNEIFGLDGVSLAEGKLIIDTSKISPLQERNIAGLMISISAPNYEATWVYQPITSGIVSSIEIETQPQGPAFNGTELQSTPILSLFDAYNNKCMDGPSSGVVVIAEILDSGEWTLSGITTRTASEGTVTFPNLTVSNITAADITNAKLRFTVDNTSIIVDSNVFTIPFGFTLTLEAYLEEGGIASIDGGSSSDLYLAGTAIAVTAIANQDYEFINWTVGGTEVSNQESFNYTMPAANITLRANFQPAGTLTPPTLTPDTTDNYGGETISIVFSYDNYKYASAIYALEIGGIEYINTEEQNVFSYGQSAANEYTLNLLSWNIPDLQKRGSHIITIKATGYSNAVVTQVITAARIHADECVTLTGPAQGITYESGKPIPEIKLQLKDKYGNSLIDGPDSGISLTAAIPQGYGGACTLSGTLEATTDNNGQIIFSSIVATLHESVQKDSLTLMFTGTYSLGYEITIYLTGSGPDDWIVFSVERQ